VGAELLHADRQMSRSAYKRILKQQDGGDVDWIDVAEIRKRSRALVNAVTKF
jgi:hypothetical protein